MLHYGWRHDGVQIVRSSPPSEYAMLNVNTALKQTDIFHELTPTQCETYPPLGYRLMYNLAADLAAKMRNTDARYRSASFTPGRQA
ncbi:MAG: hypothetical protein PHS96_03480 [Anaerolineales bacterium]|nr:hypothetical protein [Anaerolineales bacterium]